MPRVPVYNMQGEQVEEIELSTAIFSAPINEEAIHRVIVAQLANKRQGTSATLTRGKVRGGGRKPWRQKGTGRARAGTNRSPLWRGGGIIFGPQPRDYRQAVPKKLRRLALKSALSAKVRDGQIYVLEGLPLLQAKTATVAKMLQKLGLQDSVLVVIGQPDSKVQLSVRNLPRVNSLAITQLNTYDVMRHRDLVITKDAVCRAEEVLA